MVSWKGGGGGRRDFLNVGGRSLEKSRCTCVRSRGDRCRTGSGDAPPSLKQADLVAMETGCRPVVGRMVPAVLLGRGGSTGLPTNPFGPAGQRRQ